MSERRETRRMKRIIDGILFAAVLVLVAPLMFAVFLMEVFWADK